MDWLEIKEFFKDAFKYFVLVFIIIIVAVYIVGFQQVVGSSMSPTLENGNILILDKITYRFTDIDRGDVIALYSEESKYLIKRVIGLPGEKVEFRNNKLYINNLLVEETYLDNSISTDDFSLSSLEYDIIPEDMYFVVGDNRSDSQDSRDPEIGLIAKKDIVGKARIRIWPINQIKFVK